MGESRLLVSKTEAAQLLSICIRTLDHLIARKELKARHVGRRVLIPWRALEEFLRRDHETGLRRVPAEAATQ